MRDTGDNLPALASKGDASTEVPCPVWGTAPRARYTLRGESPEMTMHMIRSLETMT